MDVPDFKLSTKIINLEGGRVACHVFTPALMYRMEHKDSTIPVMALRWERDDFQRMKLFFRVKILGKSSLDPMFDDPLPGTGGRGVAIMFTTAMIQVWYQKGIKPVWIDTSEYKDPKKILSEVITKYSKPKPKPKPKPRTRSILIDVLTDLHTTSASSRGRFDYDS